MAKSPAPSPGKPTSKARQGRSWSLASSRRSTSSSAASTCSSFSSSSPAPTATATPRASTPTSTRASTLLLTPRSSPSRSTTRSTLTSTLASSTGDTLRSLRSSHTLHSALVRLSDLTRKMARPVQRSDSQSSPNGHAPQHSISISISNNAGLGQGATVVRTPMDATAHMQHAQHASISHLPGQATQSRQKCAQYPHRQSSLRSVNSSRTVTQNGASARRPSVGAAAPVQHIPRAPRIEPALEGPALQEERIEVQLLPSPMPRLRKPSTAGQSVDWSQARPSLSSSHRSCESLQIHGSQQYCPPGAQAAAPTCQQGFSYPQKLPVTGSHTLHRNPQTHGSISSVSPLGTPGLVRSPSSKSSITGPQTPVSPATPGLLDQQERSDSRSEGCGGPDDLDLGYHHRRLTSATGRSSVTITADTHIPRSPAPLSFEQSRQMRRLGSKYSLAASTPPPPGLSHSPSAASIASVIDLSDALPRLPGPMPRRRPSQSCKADGSFTPIVVGHSIRPSTQSSTLVTLRFAYSLDADPNTHTVTVTLDTLRPAGGRLVKFIEDHLRPRSGSSSADSTSSVYSTAATESGAEQGPDMTDGESVESADESDFEYDENRFPEEELADVSDADERVSPVPARPQRARRTPLSSCPTPLPPLVEAELPHAPQHARRQASPASPWPSSASSVSRQSSQRSRTYARAPQRKRASTCPSASGVATELTVLLQRDAASWHAIASRLCSGAWPLLDGRRKRVEAECAWAGMGALAHELAASPHFQRGYL